MLSESELQDILNDLLSLPAETEWVEFKEAKNNQDFSKIGKYFSALSNEANLKQQSCGWLVFGVENQPVPRRIVGSTFRSNRADLDSLKEEVSRKTSMNLTFEEIYELTTPQGRVVMFQIPPAINGIPTAWEGHFYGRNGETLASLNLNELNQILAQAGRTDWSAEICPKANLGHLDRTAIEKARRQYREKNPALAKEIEDWSDETFLNKAKLLIEGKVTNTALLLLGGESAGALLSPAVTRITWVLRGEGGKEQDYAHFDPPLLLAVDQVFERIRNLTYRYMPNATLFPTEITQYDPWVIRETLHNCIAHQDYTLRGRINVVEESESLLFTNLGDFIPLSVEEVIRRDAPPERYRNPFLAQAMVNLNMIETIGSGIKRMFQKQRERHFPLPDYDLAESRRVRVRIYGKILDENFTRVLLEVANLDLADVIALDKVQKKQPLKEDELRRLKGKKLVEGRRPNLFISSRVAAATEGKAEYIRMRAFDNNHYKRMVVSYLERFGEARRREIEKLLFDKISDALTTEQKAHKVRNLIQEMKRDGLIERKGPAQGTGARWLLAKKPTDDGD